MLKKIIKFKNGTEIIADDEGNTAINSYGTINNDYEFDIDYSEAWEIVKKVLMPKLNLKEHKIIIMETPSMKQHGFFYDQWKKSTNA